MTQCLWCYTWTAAFTPPRYAGYYGACPECGAKLTIIGPGHFVSLVKQEDMRCLSLLEQAALLIEHIDT